MTPPRDNPAESLDVNPREQRLGELINEYFDRRERGEKLTAHDFLSEHPAEADELREHLGGLDLLAKLGSLLRDATRAQTAPFRGTGSSAEDALAGAVTAFPDIPGYVVLKQIGRGGMGIVYKAIQNSTKRLVALKLLLEGPLASENARKRFEREIALAAQLKHSNIIPIYDSGQADGRMYYAMEHIFGMSLVDYIRSQEPDLKGRLQLFLKVCGPVSYAHQRGVIHRDIKPTNILVDGDGEPHILDFGLAKAGLLGEVNTSVTAQIVGTPAYMSPEQAAGDPTGVDIRVDVYALGVVLYEIVTGQMPYDTNVAMGKVLHNIAHAEPTHPSKHSRLDSDLSTIILKALEKRKEDRYQSVDALAGDISRFLADEPISAKPASSLYLLRKAAMKHRMAFGVAGMFLTFAIVLSAIVYHFSRKVEQQNVVLRETAQRVTQKEAQVEELVRQQRDQTADPRAAMEALKKVLPADKAAQLEALAKLGSDVGGSDDAVTAAAKLFMSAVVAAQEEPSKLKESPIDVDAPLTTPKPEWAKSEEPPAKPDPRREELIRIAEGVIEAMRTAPPTSQPASSQPATSQPAATASPTIPNPPTPVAVPVTQ